MWKPTTGLRERMSHVTDGELHAYLDGALTSIDPTRADRLRIHLEGCSDCTARLEDARMLRSRTGEILADAAPDLVEVPPFEAVLRRGAEETEQAGGSDDPIPISVRRSRPPLAWAASIAVALGAGWLGHAVWTGTPRMDETARSSLTQSPTAGPEGPLSAESVVRTANRDMTEGDALGQSSVSDERAGAGSLDRITIAGAVDDEAGIAGGDADRSLPAPLADRAAGRADRQGAEVPSAAAPELPGGERENRERSVTEPVPEPAPAQEPAPSVVGEQAPRAAEEVTEAEEGNEAFRAQQKTAQDAPADTRLADLVAPEDMRVEEARRGIANAPGGYYGDARLLNARLSLVTWSPVSQEQAEHWLGGPVLQVPDLPADLAIAALDEARVVRVVQTLPGGDTLELIQTSVAADEAGQMREAPGAAPAAPARFEADFAEAPQAFLVIERDGLRIMARAQVAADSLQILLSRLR